MPKPIRLKNGSVEPATVVATVMIAVDELFYDGVRNHTAVFDLYQLCLDSSHKLDPNCGKTLEDYNLIQDGRVHQSVKNVILSACSGSGLTFAIDTPVAE